MFTPRTTAICSLQAINFTNCIANGEGFDVGDLADDFKVHTPGITEITGVRQGTGFNSSAAHITYMTSDTAPSVISSTNFHLASGRVQ